MLTHEQLLCLNSKAYVLSHLEIRLVPKQAQETFKGCLKKIENLDFNLAFSVRYAPDQCAQITPEYLRALGLTLDDIWNAWLNSNPENIRLATLSEVLSELCEIPVETTSLSNEILVCFYQQGYGAACIFHPAIQKKILEKYPNGVNIVFTSVHEALISPVSYSVEGLQEILREMNQISDIVPQQDVASNFVYAVHQPCVIERMVLE